MERYFNGKPCKHGVFAERLVSVKYCRCSSCMEEVAAKRLISYRNNREMILEAGREKYLENRDEELLRAKRYRDENPEKVRESRKRYYDKHHDRNINRAREYRERNREKVLDAQRRYGKMNRGKVYARNAERRAVASKRNVFKGCELTEFVLSEAYSLSADRRVMHGFDWHVDHMIPLQGEGASGLHHWSNLQVIPASMNLSKSNRMIYTEPFEWLGEYK